MKKILLFTILFLPVLSIAQIPGSKFKGPLTTKFGKFLEGDTLKVGYGSNPNGDFRFIYQPQNVIWGTPQTSLSKMYSNTHLVIKHFKEWETSKFGIKLYTVVSIGSISNNVIELEPAIENGEIIIPGYTPGGKRESTLSAADEILKLKKLLDAGLITQDEFDKQKKKLLN